MFLLNNGNFFKDLFMLHWPYVPSTCIDKFTTLEETWRELELLYDKGK